MGRDCTRPSCISVQDPPIDRYPQVALPSNHEKVGSMLAKMGVMLPISDSFCPCPLSNRPIYFLETSANRQIDAKTARTIAELNVVHGREVPFAGENRAAAIFSQIQNVLGSKPDLGV